VRVVLAFVVVAACSFSPRDAETRDADPTIDAVCLAEVCDGDDDDCDGMIDEGFSVGTPCDGSDLDTCNEGQLACDGTCSDTTDTSQESCTGGIDDDCNGSVDCGDPACSAGAFCCTGTGLVHRIQNTCMSDFGTSGSSDTLEVYCCDGAARFCLSGEACPWRAGCITSVATCSRAGLPTDLMATATCQTWEGQTSYSCGVDEQVYFP